MEKSWFDENTWNRESSSDSDKKPAPYKITAPLPDGLKLVIKREICKMDNLDYREITDTIEKIIEISDGTALFNDLVMGLEDMMHENVKPFVAKVVMYKKKPCREGNNCRRKDLCMFAHANEDRSRSTPVSARGCMHRSEERRKTRIDDDFEYNEVIFNRVPAELWDVDTIRRYGSKFGAVRDVKCLKEGKYLIKFRSHGDARELVQSKDDVMGDCNIKKFYNKYARRTTEEDIESLFEQQDELIKRLFQSTENKEVVGKLSWITNRIKSVVLSKEDRIERQPNKRFKRDEDSGSKKDSLYCNSNFIMD